MCTLQTVKHFRDKLKKASKVERCTLFKNEVIQYCYYISSIQIGL